MSKILMTGQVVLHCGGTCPASCVVYITEPTELDDLESEIKIEAEERGWIDGQCEDCAREHADDVKGDSEYREGRDAA